VLVIKYFFMDCCQCSQCSLISVHWFV